ncbi:Inner membrane ABC transporter permease protein YjfF [Thalassoglobus neptunius]|uniref:Inner membrane ABC transporter permease protein YjfF n=1 Tax=Thalassoglobus neptunius TaxID=1938619 RepID=A0A5C5WGT2_9PLAN|nr:ABC transporter permease [Thalassoglobus neptunius]TWT49870.1 Inner membrane ABC transporter permease protein YjfF [Thalassoglobus neptunius]
MELLKKHRNEFGLVLAIAVVTLVTTWLSPSYQQQPVDNAQSIMRHAAMLGVFAFGAAIVIIAGGIDLSSGSVIAFSGTLFFGLIVLLVPKTDRGQPMTGDVATWILVVSGLATLFCAVLIGTFHAWLINIIELPPFVATLASLVGLRSLARLLSARMTGSEQITVNDERLQSIGSEAWWIPVALWIVLAIAFWILMNRTIIGRHLYAMGGNETAAKLSGIQTDRLKWLAYCIGSVTAAISGILYAAYVGSVSAANAGLGYELNAIASAVVGGCSLAGGIGTIPGVMLGALFLRLVIDSVQKLAVTNSDRIEGLVVGVLVVLAVAVNTLRFEGGRSKQFFPGWLGLMNVGILSLIAGVLYAVTATEHAISRGFTVGLGILFVLAIRAVYERASNRPRTR